MQFTQKCCYIYRTYLYGTLAAAVADEKRNSISDDGISLAVQAGVYRIIWKAHPDMHSVRKVAAGSPGCKMILCHCSAADAERLGAALSGAGVNAASLAPGQEILL